MSDDQLLAVAQGLIAGWDGAAERLDHDPRKDHENTLAVFGLAAHVHRLASAYLLLHAEG